MAWNKFMGDFGRYSRRTDLEPWRHSSCVFRLYMTDAGIITKMGGSVLNELSNPRDAASNANSIIHNIICTVLDEDHY